MVIMWTITLMMTMQREIGLVGSNTMRWLILILMVFTLVALLVNFIQSRKATWPAGVSHRLWRVNRPQPQESAK
jgi:hypothetical protein